DRELPFDDVESLDWPSAVVVEDMRKDYGERRFRVFGYIEDRLYALVFTPRENAVHVISFRKANSREVKRYG
ncbi:MAG: BrnT family toxin, partial [Gallionellaceae bacterium]